MPVSPSWLGREPEPERAPDGEEVVRTRFGPHIRTGPGRMEPYTPPDQLIEKLFRRRPRGGMGQPDWSVWDY